MQLIVKPTAVRFFVRPPTSLQACNRQTALAGTSATCTSQEFCTRKRPLNSLGFLGAEMRCISRDLRRCGRARHGGFGSSGEISLGGPRVVSREDGTIGRRRCEYRVWTIDRPRVHGGGARPQSPVFALTGVAGDFPHDHAGGRCKTEEIFARAGPTLTRGEMRSARSIDRSQVPPERLDISRTSSADCPSTGRFPRCNRNRQRRRAPSPRRRRDP
jgi:hypothetical protein